MGPSSSDRVLQHLSGQRLRVDPRAAAELRTRADGAIRRAWEGLSADWCTVFRGPPGGGLLNPKGYPEVKKDALDRLVRRALRELADEDGRPPEVDPGRCRNSLEPLGVWGGCHPDLRRCRDLFRAAELARLGGREGASPRYGLGDGFRSWEPNLSVYRSPGNGSNGAAGPHAAVFVPPPGNVFLRGVIRDLPLAVALALTTGPDPAPHDLNRLRFVRGMFSDDLFGNPCDGPVGDRHPWLSDLPDLAVFDRLAAAESALLRLDTEPGVVEISDEFDEEFRKAVDRLARGDPDLGNRSRVLSAAAGTLPLGLPPSLRVRLLQGEYVLDVGEAELRRADRFLADTMIPPLAAYGADDKIELASRAAGIDPNLTTGCLLGLTSDASAPHPELLKTIRCQGLFMDLEAWGSLRRLTPAGRGEVVDQQAVLATLGRGLVGDLDPPAGGRRPAPGIVLRLFETLLCVRGGADRDSLRGRVRDGLRRPARTLGGREIPRGWPAAVRREEFLRSGDDVMLRVGGGLLDAGFRLVALTGGEFLVEAPETGADTGVVRRVAEGAARELLGVHTPPIVMTLDERW